MNNISEYIKNRRSVRIFDDRELSKNDYLICLERKEDYPVVENLIRELFFI